MPHFLLQALTSGHTSFPPSWKQLALGHHSLRLSCQTLGNLAGAMHSLRVGRILLDGIEQSWPVENSRAELLCCTFQASTNFRLQ